jgi:hypothetical protein
MNDKARILRDYGRFCGSRKGCYECEMSIIKTGELSCRYRLLKNPEKAVEIIEAWAKEHPEKTYKQDFLEKFPNAKLNERGIPYPCREYLYGKGINCAHRNADCAVCWNEPMEG